jgi:hypothetical protein
MQEGRLSWSKINLQFYRATNAEDRPSGKFDSLTRCLILGDVAKMHQHPNNLEISRSDVA